MQSIIFTQGIQGSGKSHWAKKQCQVDKFKRVNRDELRLMLDNTQFDLKNERFITIVEEEIIRSALAEGYSVIIDSMNLNISRLDKRIQEYTLSFPDIQVKTVVFNEELKECIRRDSFRENPLGEEIITNTYNKYKHVLDTL